MNRGAFAEYLAGLDERSLVSLLQARPDVRTQPVPSGFGQLAQRLGGADSLVAALQTINRDAVAVGQAVAALGERATVPELVRLLEAPEGLVRDGLTELLGRGLAWRHEQVLRLPERLAQHWSAEIGGGRPVAKIAHAVLAEDLRLAAQALGIAADGLRKPELIARIGEAMADVRSLAARVARLSKPARDRLDELRHGVFGDYFEFGYGGPRRGGATELLVTAGLALRVRGQAELPWEVAVAAWLAESRTRLTGPPSLPAAGTDATAVHSTAQAAVHEALRATTALLDRARTAPIAALKKGGIGPRERTRLARRLATTDDMLMLWIDLAYAAGLLGRTDAGYAPTDAYPSWRDAEPARRWAVLASAWFWLEHAPTSREVDDDREQPPPLPLASTAGPMRRALLTAARGGAAVHTAARHVDWFFPLHGYDDAGCAAKAAAAVREAELLGVTAAGVLSELGEHLLDAKAAPDPVDDLAARCTELLPEPPCGVIVQSDLTAVVSGQPSVAVSRLLAAAAANETGGAAATWRFTPASIRAALDAGWTADDLLTELKAVSDRPVPQPLEYLITDAARRHGQVRVRGMRSCIVAAEALITEILHTRSLAKLHLSQVAPTVLASPFELDDVLAKLRAAGLSPVAEDAMGAVIVEERPEHQAVATRAAAGRPVPRLTAAELAAQLAADPDGAATPVAGTDVVHELARLNRLLDDAELALLADAVINHRDVVIAYRDRNGSHSIRQITPQQIYGNWLDSWCHLRNAQRDFTIAKIESVAPTR